MYGNRCQAPTPSLETYAFFKEWSHLFPYPILRTPETALELAAALGNSAEFWTNLESNYRLHIARKKKDEQEIVRKNRLYSLAPIPELIKRGWIEAAESVDELEKEICN